MKLEFNKKDSFCLPQKELARALDGAGEEDLKVLLMLCALTPDGSFDTDECKSTVVEATGIGDTEFESAVAYWRGARVLKLKKGSKAKKEQEDNLNEKPERKAKKTLIEDKLPNYSEDEMAEKIDATKGLKDTIDECQQIIGKIFSPADTAVIVGLSDRLGLSGEYIIMLAAYCVGTGKKSLRYIEKTACSMYDDGVDTVERLAELIKKKESMHEVVPTIKRMVGAGTRELSDKEEKLVEKWLCEFGYDIETIKLAYEKSIPHVQNGQFIPYMGGIIDRWYKQGLRTFEDINEMLGAYRQSKSEALGGFDTDDAFEKAVNKTMRNRAKKKTVEAEA